MIRSLVNGEPRDQVSILDRGLQFGDGLFETLAVTAGHPCLWEYHIQRLQAGCERLGITAPDACLLEQEARELLADQQRAVLKITVTRGISDRGYKPSPHPSPTRILALFDWDGPATHALKIAVSRRRLGNNPDLAGIKHLNRLEQVLARAECPADIDEALMLDHAGNVIEGMMSNLFFQKGRQLYTPSLQHCGVEGVVKALILDIASRRKVQIETGNYTLEDVLQADALYLTSSLAGVRHVSQIAGYDWRPQVAELHPVLADAGRQVFD